MFPIVLIGLAAYFGYKYVEAHGMPFTTPAAAAAATPLLPTVGVTHLIPGARYAFTLASNMSADAIHAGLQNVGATLDSALQGPTPISGTAIWAGTFTWEGASGEPVENLPGIQWTSVDFLPSADHPTDLNAPPIVSGWGDSTWNPMNHMHKRASLARY